MYAFTHLCIFVRIWDLRKDSTLKNILSAAFIRHFVAIKIKVCAYCGQVK